MTDPKDKVVSAKVEARKLIARFKIVGGIDVANVKLAEEILAHDFGEGHSDCRICRAVLGVDKVDILPRYGNLLDVLEKEAVEEKVAIEATETPSQNDLLRWALKDAVLAYYQGLGFEPDKPVVHSKSDTRLIPDIAPDFDKIAVIWLQRLDELARRDDKYCLLMDEYDKAEEDLSGKMRGSSAEKRIDRYREEFVKRLIDSVG